MDRETVVESLFEIATHGEYEKFAKEQIHEQLRGHGYSDDDIDVVIKVVSRASNEANVKSFAEALVCVLEDKVACANYIYNPKMLYMLCLMMTK